MRLLLVMPSIASYHAFLSEVGDEMCRDGAEVHLATSTRKFENPQEDGEASSVAAKPGELTIHAIEFARGMNPVTHLRAARQLDALVARLKPDVIHAHFDAAIFTTAIARKRHWPATIATFHGLSFPILSGWRKLVIRSATAWAVRHYDAVWVLNSENLGLLRVAAPGADIRSFRSSGVGCDIERFAPPPKAERDAIRATLGFTPAHRVFTYVGRLVEAKGFGVTVRAFLEFAKADPNARLPEGYGVRGLAVGEEERSFRRPKHRVWLPQ